MEIRPSIEEACVLRSLNKLREELAMLGNRIPNPNKNKDNDEHIAKMELGKKKNVAHNMSTAISPK
ncbi:MAG: hypothetical protein K2Y18_07110 [Alphaproteobacteria bacterium]|jgi:hypothetical protein|nr:hypothetical protein [Alphaproteobacteria bacterium]